MFLDELDEIKMCVQYELNGKKNDYLPAAVEDQLKVKPIYKTFQDGKLPTKGIRNIERSCLKMQKNIFMLLEDFIGAKISSISTSPEREDTILLENPFNNLICRLINFLTFCIDHSIFLKFFKSLCFLFV